MVDPEITVTLTSLIHQVRLTAHFFPPSGALAPSPVALEKACLILREAVLDEVDDNEPDEGNPSELPSRLLYVVLINAAVKAFSPQNSGVVSLVNKRLSLDEATDRQQALRAEALEMLATRIGFPIEAAEDLFDWTAEAVAAPWRDEERLATNFHRQTKASHICH